jgi:hypothetical protein
MATHSYAPRFPLLADIAAPVINISLNVMRSRWPGAQLSGSVGAVWWITAQQLTRLLPSLSPGYERCCCIVCRWHSWIVLSGTAMAASRNLS